MLLLGFKWGYCVKGPVYLMHWVLCLLSSHKIIEEFSASSYYVYLCINSRFRITRDNVGVCLVLSGGGGLKRKPYTWGTIILTRDPIPSSWPSVWAAAFVSPSALWAKKEFDFGSLNFWAYGENLVLVVSLVWTTKKKAFPSAPFDMMPCTLTVSTIIWHSSGHLFGSHSATLNIYPVKDGFLDSGY